MTLVRHSSWVEGPGARSRTTHVPCPSWSDTPPYPSHRHPNHVHRPSARPLFVVDVSIFPSRLRTVGLGPLPKTRHHRPSRLRSAERRKRRQRTVEGFRVVCLHYYLRTTLFNLPPTTRPGDKTLPNLLRQDTLPVCLRVAHPEGPSVYCHSPVSGYVRESRWEVDVLLHS